MYEADYLLQNISCVRDIAWQHSNKYKYDPHLSRVHNEYLEMLNLIIDNAKEQKKAI